MWIQDSIGLKAGLTADYIRTLIGMHVFSSFNSGGNISVVTDVNIIGNSITGYKADVSKKTISFNAFGQGSFS